MARESSRGLRGRSAGMLCGTTLGVLAAVALLATVASAQGGGEFSGGEEDAECPLGEEAGSMAVGQRGLELVKGGDKRRAASCFWRAADTAGEGAPLEQLTWLRNAAQASEEGGDAEDAALAWRQLFDVQQEQGQVPALEELSRAAG
ncbi:hypothetical protein T484DRAFT_1891368, partial [Baffinella frigidus]